MTVHWGFFADAIGHTGPSSALVVKQRLGGPTRALMLLVKADGQLITLKQRSQSWIFPVGHCWSQNKDWLLFPSPSDREKRLLLLLRLYFWSLLVGYFRLQACPALSPMHFGSWESHHFAFLQVLRQVLSQPSLLPSFQLSEFVTHYPLDYIQGK